MSYVPVYLIFGLPGSRRDDLILPDRFINYPLEKEILQLSFGSANSEHSKNFLTALSNHTKESFSRLYIKALAKLIDRIEKESPAVATVSAPLVLQKYSTYELFSPLSEQEDSWFNSCFRRQTVIIKGIHVIIDDVYDVFMRLSADENGMLHKSLLIGDDLSEFFAKIESEELQQEEGRSRFSFTIDLALQILARQFSALQSLLSWRHQEMVTAYSLSRRLRVPYSVVALKHKTTLLNKLLTNSSRLRKIYVSHPISGPRKTNQKTEQWPQYVDDFMDAIHRFSDHEHLAAFMPTAIDEFRFKKDKLLIPCEQGKDIRSEEVSIQTVYMSDRWKYPQQDSLFEPPKQYSEDKNDVGTEYYQQTNNFFSDYVKKILEDQLEDADTEAILNSHRFRLESSGIVKSFTEDMRVQMANRDHFLVSFCTGGLLLFRPLYLEEAQQNQDDNHVVKKHPRYSRGVLSEIDLFFQNVWLELGDRINPDFPYHSRKIVFIHDVKDYQRYLDYLFEPIPGQDIPDRSLNKFAENLSSYIDQAKMLKIQSVKDEPEHYRALLKLSTIFSCNDKNNVKDVVKKIVVPTGSSSIQRSSPLDLSDSDFRKIEEFSTRTLVSLMTGGKQLQNDLSHRDRKDYVTAKVVFLDGDEEQVRLSGVQEPIIKIILLDSSNEQHLLKSIEAAQDFFLE